MRRGVLFLSSILCLLAIAALWAQAPAAKPGGELLTPDTFEGSRSLTLSSGTLELIFLPQGASMASLVMLDDSEKLNPLWNSVRLNREQGRKADPNSTTGHLVCVDGFGPVSPEESKAGLPMLGEAHLQPFEIQANKSGTTAEVTLTAKLPIVQEMFTRIIRMVDGENVVYVESQLENLMGFDRPINWGEHATVGSPFVEAGVTVFDLSGVRSRTTPYTQPTGPGGDTSVERRLASEQDFSWPLAPGRTGSAGICQLRGKSSPKSRPGKDGISKQQGGAPSFRAALPIGETLSVRLLPAANRQGCAKIRIQRLGVPLKSYFQR